MKRAFLSPIALAGIVLLLSLPSANGAAAPPVSGTVTNCLSTTTCSFSFNTTAGTGWASTTATTLSLQLPGEANASQNLTYGTYVQLLTGTYTYWTVGNFLGTDRNTGFVIYGTTDTNFTITCVGHSGRGGGCTYVDTTDNGTIVVKFTQQEQTLTSLSCTPTTIRVPGKSTCTVTVTNLWNSSNVPSGKVKFSAGGLGYFSNRGSCTLTAGKCTIAFHPYDNTLGTVTITGSYLGTTAFYPSAGAMAISVQ